MVNVKKIFSRIGWSYFVFMLVGSAAGALIMIPVFLFRILGLGSGSAMDDANLVLLLSQIGMYGVGLPVFCLMLRPLPVWEKKNPGDLSAAQFLGITVFCFGATYIGSLAGQGLMALFGSVSGADVTDPLTSAMSGMNVPMVALTTVVIAPVMEELLFRKLLVDRLVPFGQRAAVVVSGVAFGLFHGNFYQFFYATVLGMIFAYLYSATGRIRYNILLHMIINVVGGVISLVISRGLFTGQPWARSASTALGVFMVITIIAAIVMFFAKLRKLPWFPAWVIPERGMFRTLIAAPGVWAFAVMCVVTFAASMSLLPG